MTLVEQLRAYIAPDDNMEDHDDIRALMHAGADRLAQLESALKGTLSAMEMQIGREAGELHIHSAAAWKIWSDAVTAARACFPVETVSKPEIGCVGCVQDIPVAQVGDVVFHMPSTGGAFRCSHSKTKGDAGGDL